MENKKMLKLSWRGSGVLLLSIALYLVIKIFKLGDTESESVRYLSESLFYTVKGMVVHGLIGLIYILFNQKPSFKKKWTISGLVLYLSILIPVLLLAISDERYTLLGGIFYAQWMIFGAFLMFFYLLFNFIYAIHMGFRKLLSKKGKKSSPNKT